MVATMKLHSFLSSVLVTIFWINGRGNCLSPENENSQESEQFTIYKQCIQKHSVPTWVLLGPAYNQSFYTSQNNRFNLLFEKAYPIAIIIPTEVQHVQVAVRCGVEARIQLVPISGGHSYAGLSFGSNDSIVIDFQYMNGVSVNREKQFVTVESGALMAKVYGTLWRNGRLGAPLGLCATVAMGGLVLSGGLGFYAGLYGLVIDNLLEINMVDAHGNAVVADPQHNEDLWWALRGAGPGYIGLVTSVKMRVFETDDIKLTFVMMKFDHGSFKTVMESYIKWLDWTKENEPSIASVIVIKKGGISAQLLQLTHRKIKSTGNAAFPDVLLSIFPEPVDYSVTYPTFTEFTLLNNMTMLTPEQRRYMPEDDQGQLDFLATITKDKAHGYYFYEKGFYVKKRYNAEQLEQVQKVVKEIQDDNVVWINSELGLTAFNAPEYDSAFVHRDALFYAKSGLMGDNVNNVGPAKEWVDKFYDSMRFLDNGETYQGNPEKNLTDYLRRYYGSNLERLIEIKRKWDPEGYFNTEQSIPVS